MIALQLLMDSGIVFRTSLLPSAMESPVSEMEVSITGPHIMLTSMILAYAFLAAILLFLIVFLYDFLEFHFVGDFFRGFRGDPVKLTFDPNSKIYENVVSKCRVLQGRYLATPWLSSPHFQIAFLTFHGRPPVFNYRRQLFSLSDAGTIALDWLYASEVAGSLIDNDRIISNDDGTPIVIVLPGLTSDSSSSYIKHLAFKLAKQGWNVVIENHRGLGGVPITSDRFYHSGWTEDVREVANYIHHKFSKAPLFAIGTSIGANILVKYLGEEEEKTPVVGAAAICSPWDLVVADRFINRNLVQRFYDRVLTIGLKGYAQLHQQVLARLINMDGMKKLRHVRDFDNHVTRIVASYETVDTYYRCSSSAGYVGKVSIPLLCISALDDPVCTKEAIPWDECRANKNVVLATTVHGSHLAYFEGLTASSLWWVRAAHEFLSLLYSGPYTHEQKIGSPGRNADTPIDKAHHLDSKEDGFVTESISDGSEGFRHQHDEDIGAKGEEDVLTSVNEGEDRDHDADAKSFKDASATKFLKQLSRQNRKSIWLLVYIAIASSWPLVGSALRFFLRNKLKNSSGKAPKR